MIDLTFGRRCSSLEVLEERVLLAADVQIQLRTVTQDLSAPLVATHADDGSGRMFVAQQGGQIRVVQGSLVSPQPFLDLGGGGLNRVVTGGERGLLGLAFHPDFSSLSAPGRGRFYVYYSAPSSSGGNHDSVVSEFRVSADPNRADVTSERELLRFPQPFSNHNGGDIHFGPDDGLLYVATGDGGSGGDPQNNAQNLTNLLGKILRIDVLGTNASNGQYGIPASNPFVDRSGVRGEIYAYGLRNPYRFSFDDGPTPESVDRLFAGDVGQFLWEEVDLIESGGNYGWRIREGAHPFNRSDPNPGGLIDPIAEYPNDATTDSVIGGFVYRGSRYPALFGRYLFGDLTGRMFVLEEDDGVFQLSDLEVAGGNPPNIIGFGEDEDGELYVLTFGAMLAIEVETVSLRGRVFHDRDSSGGADIGEEYLNGWTVELLDEQGQTVAVQQTQDVDLDGDEAIDPATERGWYQFDVPPGVYTVRQLLKDGWQQTAPLDPVESLAFALGRQFRFTTKQGLFENWGGLEEKWLQSTNQANAWYFIVPSGELWEWDRSSGLPLGSPLEGRSIGTLDPRYYEDPQLLVDVAAPTGSFVLQVAAGQPLINRDFGNRQLATLSGRVYHDLNVDGERDVGEPYLNGWTVELLDAQGQLIATEQTRDIDLDASGVIDPLLESGWYQFAGLETGDFTINVVPQADWQRTAPVVPPNLEFAFELDQRLNFFTTGNLWENWGGLAEKWLQAGGGEWYYITAGGELREWDGASGVPLGRPLAGTLVARLDDSFYADPTRLIDLGGWNVPITTGQQLADRDFGFALVL